MDNKCEATDCKLSAFKNTSKCALHTDKSDLNFDKSSHRKNNFDDYLVTYIINFIKSTVEHKSDNSVNEDKLKNYLGGRTSTSIGLKDVITSSIIKGVTILFDSILFSTDSSNETLKCIDILKKLDKIHFKNCIFIGGDIPLNEVEVFYQGCAFFSEWDIQEKKVLSEEADINNKKVLFQNCKFHESVKFCNQKTLEFSLFNNCSFFEMLELSDQDFNFQPFNNTGESELICSKLKIENCTFSAKFLFNHTKLDEVIIKNSVFKEKFEFKKNSVDKFEIDNSNFKKLFDAYKTKFIKFSSFKSIYDDFVGFEKCQFGISEKNSQEKGCSVSRFTYTTFMSFTNFRSTKFNSGLDLKNTNLKEPPNFLNSELDPEFTNRETFRVIKDSFDQIGNHIEANRFFVDEMRKYREELKLKKGCSQEKFIFHLNYFVSNFGSSYVKPIMWILLTLIVFHLLVIGHEKNLLYKVLPIYNQEIAFVTGLLNKTASYALPFKKFLLPGMELISLVFYIIIISLVWQAVNALKRHTKR